MSDNRKEADDKNQPRTFRLRALEPRRHERLLEPRHDLLPAQLEIHRELPSPLERREDDVPPDGLHGRDGRREELERADERLRRLVVLQDG